MLDSEIHPTTVQSVSLEVLWESVTFFTCWYDQTLRETIVCSARHSSIVKFYTILIQYHEESCNPLPARVCPWIDYHSWLRSYASVVCPGTEVGWDHILRNKTQIFK